jgi:two-component system CheB/CheR fusion protein
MISQDQNDNQVPPEKELPPAPELPKGTVGEGKGNSPFPIVGIGASAGGLEAMRQLFSNLPADTGMAFVVVQHLDPSHESRLPELLARSTKMPVLEATHAVSVQPNFVYIIPPNARIALGQGILHITPRAEGRGPHLPIDYLFRSLAEDQQSRAVAVVLSGTGSDGTQGVCEIKAVGGITFSQDEKTAVHSGMPLSAIQSGCIDFVLPPDQIAVRLAAVGGHPYLVAAEQQTAEAEATTEVNYQKILASVRALTGVDFTHYRDTTIKRRIMRRMALNTQQSLTDYAARLRTDPAEVEALSRDLLINVTSFFRESEMFDALKTSVFPDLVKSKSPSQPIRIWVPGCSAGQEGFSLAMATVEYFDSQPVRPVVQIFATDLDQSGLDKARAGIYPEGIEGEVSPERLRRFFKREDHVFRIDKSIRDMCVFARQNVTADPPFSHLDLISCRNVLIYLTTPLQKRVMSAFHYALNSPGFLVLGAAETVGEFTELFEMTDRAHRIYVKKPMPHRPVPMFPTTDYRSGTLFTPRAGGLPGPATADFQKEADRVLLGRFAPPGVLVDANFDILQFRGRTSAYLESPPGEPTANVLKLAREGLFLELRNALTEAKKSNQAVRREDVRVRSNGGVHKIALEVMPVRPQGNSVCYLVLFQEPPAPPSAPVEKPSEPPHASEVELANEVVQLRQELAATREYLQSMLEQQDAANEELRSANEEILSSNEELQSTNEELETAKEELQSANEELTTVNEQLQRRNVELDQVNNDLINLLSSTNIPVVMVGGDLRIRRFTPPSKKAMSLLPTDIGRPIGDIKPALLVPDLEDLIAEVIERVQPVEREIHDRDGHSFMLRIHPYRTSDNRIDGAVLLLVDIDQVQRDAEELRRRAALIELSQDAVIVRDSENRVHFWNHGAKDMYGWNAEEAKGQQLDQLLGTYPETWKELNAELDEKGAWEGELQQKKRDGSPVLVHSREVLVRNESGQRSTVLAIKRDITERKKMLEALKEADRRKDEFLAILAHELRNPLTPICNAVLIMKQAGNDSAAFTMVRDMLDRQVAQLSRIVEDLIDVSRITRGKIELRKERVELASIIRLAVESCRPLTEAAKQEMTVALPTEPIYLHADPVRLAQVLNNLLSNASKYSEPGSRIWLTAEKQGEEAAITVKDTGIGIPLDQLESVFNMFTQVEGNSERSQGGLGIGLTLVRRLVQMHGGTVTADSEGRGRGSRFVVRLPIPRGRTKTDHATPTEMPSIPNARRFLVVDDNSDSAASLTKLLELTGKETQIAHDGFEALAAAEKFNPDVVLLDIGLPKLNGYAVCRRIREQPWGKKMVLVAMTGWGQDQDRRKSREAGFDHHLIKPVDFAALMKLLADSQGSPGTDKQAT